MEGMFFLIPITLVMGVASFAVLLWSLKARQYDDPEGDARRILNPDDFPLP